MNGFPANRLAKWALQPPRTSKPQFAGRSGATSTPRWLSVATQAPSEPRRDQLPPPSASTTASAWRCDGPVGVSKHRPTVPLRPDATSLQPLQRWRMWNCTGTPDTGWRRRCNQARNSGAAFMSDGNTRPDVPTNVLMPSVPAQSRRSAAPKCASRCATSARRAAKRVSNKSAGSEWVRFKPPLPASRNLRPTLGIVSNRCTAIPAALKSSAAISPAGPPPTTITVYIGWSSGCFRPVRSNRLARSGMPRAPPRRACCPVRRSGKPAAAPLTRAGVGARGWI